MNAVAELPVTTPAIGSAYGGGFVAGHYIQDGQARVLIVAPKSSGGRIDPIAWNDSEDEVAGATSFIDGLANTDAMAAAGSEVAKTVRALTIGGFTDWCIPAVDQLELVYRNLKPGSSTDSPYYRSGINLHAIPPTLPYSHQPAAQTPITAFQAGGEQAIETDEESWYWTSTQHAGDSDTAWVQDFGDGGQDYDWKGNEYRVLAVRSEVIR